MEQIDTLESEKESLYKEISNFKSLLQEENDNNTVLFISIINIQKIKQDYRLLTDNYHNLQYEYKNLEIKYNTANEEYTKQITELNEKLLNIPSSSSLPNYLHESNPEQAKTINELKEQIKVLQHSVMQKQRDVDSISSERSILEDRNRHLTDELYRVNKQYKDPESLEYNSSSSSSKRSIVPLSSLCPNASPSLKRVYIIYFNNMNKQNINVLDAIVLKISSLFQRIPMMRLGCLLYLTILHLFLFVYMFFQTNNLDTGNEK